MRKPLSISNSEARKIILSCQGLSGSIGSPVDIIHRLGYVQIDTISVIERAHHHLLFTRDPNYLNSQLDQLMSERKVFEYWSHAAAILPMRDFRYSLYLKAQFANGKYHWFQKDKKVMRHVLRRIKEEGPLQSKDFENDNKLKHPWGDWKPAKMAMTELFMEGKLMVSERKGFQKVFDLTERVVPSGVDLTRPTKKEFCRYLIETSIEAHGLITEKEINYLRRGLQPTLKNTLKEMISSKEVLKVQIEGLDEMYFSNESIVSPTHNDNEELHILSPFDNLVIQRDRLNKLFGFDYLIECYVPEKKRKFGYFCLPILYGDRFVGRLDPKADRKSKTLYVKKIWYEDDFKVDDDFRMKLDGKLQALSFFCRCDKVVYQ